MARADREREERKKEQEQEKAKGQQQALSSVDTGKKNDAGKAQTPPEATVTKKGQDTGSPNNHANSLAQKANQTNWNGESVWDRYVTGLTNAALGGVPAPHVTNNAQDKWTEFLQNMKPDARAATPKNMMDTSARAANELLRKPINENGHTLKDYTGVIKKAAEYYRFGENERLNQINQQERDRINSWPVDKTGMDVDRDAYELTKQYYLDMAAAYDLNKDDPFGKDPVGIAQRRMEEGRDYLMGKYAANGKTPEQIKGMLEAGRFESPAMQWQKGRQSVVDFAKERFGGGDMDYDSADKLLQKNSPAYDMLKKNGGGAEELRDAYDRLPQIVEKVWSEGIDGLTEAEARAYFSAQGTDNTELKRALLSQDIAAATPILKAFAGQMQEELTGMEGLFAKPAASPYNRALWEAYINTPEGAKDYLDSALGTDYEWEANNNYYNVTRREKFDAIALNPDFADLAKPDKEFKSGNGALDTMYRYVNDIGNYRDTRGIQTTVGGGNDWNMEALTYMTKEEQDKFNALSKAGHHQDALDYIDFIRPQLNERATETALDRQREFTQSGPWAAALMNAGSVLENQVAGVAGLMDYGAQYLGQRFQPYGERKPLDTNTVYQLPAKSAAEIRQTTQGMIDEAIGDNDTLKYWVDQGYNGVMSMLDSTTTALALNKLGVGGKLASSLSAMITASRSGQEAFTTTYERTGDPDLAALNAGVAYAAEALPEKITLDHFMSMVNGKSDKGALKVIFSILGEMGENGLQEGITEVADIARDVKLQKGKGEYAEMAQYMRDMGVNDDKIMSRIVQSMGERVRDATVGGVVMGAFSGPQGSITGALREQSAQRDIGRAVTQDGQAMLKDVATLLGGEAGEKAGKYNPGQSKARATGQLAELVAKEAQGRKLQGQGVISQEGRALLQEIAAAQGEKAGNTAKGYDPATATDQDTAQLLRQVMKDLPRNPQGDRTRQLLHDNMALNIRQQIEGIMGEKGSMESNSRAADALATLLEGEALSPEQTKALAGNDGGMALMRQLMGGQQAEAAKGAAPQAQAQEAELTDVPGLEDKPIDARAAEAAADQQAQPEAQQAVQDREQNVHAPEMNEEPAKVNPPAADQQGQQAQTQAQEAEAAADRQAQPEAPQAVQDREQNVHAPEMNEEPAKVNPPAAKDQQAQPEAKPEAPEEKQAPIQVKVTDENGQEQERGASFRHTEDGLVADLDNGQEAAADDLNLSDGDRETVNAADRIGNDRDANEMISLLSGEGDAQTARSRANAYVDVYQKAARGETYERAASLFEGLSDDQRRAAWEAGNRQWQAQLNERRQKNQASARRDGVRTVEQAKEGEAGLFYADVTGEVDGGQKLQLRLIHDFAAQNGLQVRLYDSLGNVNGELVRGTNIVNLALDAQEGALTRTVSHEGYHYIMENDQAAGKEISDYVKSRLKAAEGYDLEKRIREVQKQYRDENGQELSRAQAMEEIVADSLIDVIGTRDGVKNLALKTGTARTIAQWLEKTVEGLKRIIGRLSLNSPEARAMEQDVEGLAQIRDMYLEAMRNIQRNSAQAQEALYNGIKDHEAVQEYVKDRSESATGEDAQAAVNALISQVFMDVEREWIEQHPDEYEEGYNKFQAALRAFGEGKVKSLAMALGQQGLNAAANERLNMLSNYAARQLVGLDTAEQSNGDTLRQAEERMLSLRTDADERNAQSAVEDTRSAPDLYAQMKMDGDARAALELLQQLHRQTTQGGEEALIKKGAFESRLSDIAQKILEDSGSKYGKSKLMRELRTLYRGMEQTTYSAGEMLAYARDVMQRVLEAAPGTLVEMDDTTKEVIKTLRNTPFFLTKDQKNEIRNTYGAVSIFMRKNFGKMRIRKQGTKTSSLSEVWRESLATLSPGTFAADVNEADMPGILDAWLENAHEKKFADEFGRNIGAHSTDMAMNAMLDFYNVPGALIDSQDRVLELRQLARQAVEDAKFHYQEKYQDRIDKIKDAKNREALRRKITSAVRNLNSMIVRPTDARHVPESMRGAVIEAVKPFLSNTGVFTSGEMIRLAYEYSLLEDMEEEIEGFDEDILDTIRTLPDRLSGRRLSQLNEAELNDLNDIVGNLRKIVSEENKRRVNNTQATVKELSTQLKADMAAMKEAKQGKAASAIRALSYKETTPVYFADRVGGVIGEMVREFFRGEEDWAFNYKAAGMFAQEMYEKYNADKWMFDKHTLRFTSAHGDALELNRREALTLYALWKRETTNKLQDANHLRIGGFMYQKGTKYKGVDILKPHPITESDMAQVGSYLTKDQIAFADEMVGYLTKMGKLGNEVSMEMYGYKKFKEKYYFPYQTDRRFLVGDLIRKGKKTKQPKNAGWTKATLRNAATPITLRNFMDVFANHANQMCIYHAFAQNMDTMNRVFNDRLNGEAHVNAETGRIDITTAESNWIAMERALGEEGVNYITTLAKDVAGGVRVDERGNFVGKGLSAFKKASVAANLSVVVQQPTAIGRAIMMVNPKYLLASNPMHLSQNIKEMYQYSGVAIIKDMGKFDTGTGKTAVEWMMDGLGEETKAKSAMAFIDKWTGIGAEKADEWTWGLLWGAIKKETEHRRADLNKGTEEFYQAVAERFNDVARHTQVYDSTLSRSEWMRSNTTMDKMVTAFKAEPTLGLNMLMDAITTYNQEGNGAKKVARAAAAFTLNNLLTAVAKSMVTATRKKNDDGRTWLEKYLGDLVANFSEDMSPFGIAGLIPWVQDAISIFDGYSVERSDMTTIQSLADAVKILENDNKSVMDKVEATAGAVGNLFGVPLKNIMRDLRALTENLNGVRSKPISETSAAAIKYTMLDNLSLAPIPLWDSGKDAYYGRMEKALIAGDMDKYEELRDYVEGSLKTKGDTVTSKLKARLGDSVAKGLISDDQALDIMVEKMGLEDKKAYEAIEKAVQEAAHKEDEEYSYTRYGELKNLVLSGGDIAPEVEKLTQHGSKEKDVQSEVKKVIKEAYQEGDIDRDGAEKKMNQYLPDLDADTVYWTLDEWEYNNTHDKESDNYSRYVDVFAAAKEGKPLSSAMQELTDHGYEEKNVLSQVKSQIGKWYTSGEMDRATAEKRLKQYTDLDENGVYWAMDEWDFNKAHANDKKAPAYKKYDSFFKALESGENLLQESKRYLEHGVKKETIGSQITGQYKEQYIALYKAGKTAELATLKARILTAYEAVGYDRTKKAKDIDNWLKEKK